MTLEDLLAKTAERRRSDKERYAALDEDECQLCFAHGQDKRSLRIACLYAVHEAVPEAIDLFECDGVLEELKSFYYLRLCKSCRGRLLGHLRDWCNECVALRGRRKDHDGGLLDDDREDANIPVRVMGRTVMMTWDEYRDWWASKGLSLEDSTEEPGTL